MIGLKLSPVQITLVLIENKNREHMGRLCVPCRSIPLNGYGKIYATQLPNGFYQLANGHHRVVALKSLGKETIKIFLTK